MNKRGNALILVSWFLLIYCGVMLGYSFYDYSGAKKMCEPVNGSISVEHHALSRSSYSCIIDNNKYEMADTIGDGWKIINYDANALLNESGGKG